MRRGPHRPAGVRLLALRRPPWVAVADDRWREVADAGAAVRALGDAPRRVFLALGRNEIAPFVAAPQHHYLVRSVDPVEPPLRVPHARYVIGRGPVRASRRSCALVAHGIEIVVAKNSGGEATYGKIAAALARSAGKSSCSAAHAAGGAGRGDDQDAVGGD